MSPFSTLVLESEIALLSMIGMPWHRSGKACWVAPEKVHFYCDNCILWNRKHNIMRFPDIYAIVIQNPSDCYLSARMWNLLTSFLWIFLETICIRHSSSKKKQGKPSKRIHKAEREKKKRDHMNVLFVELRKAIGIILLPLVLGLNSVMLCLVYSITDVFECLWIGDYLKYYLK